MKVFIGFVKLLFLFYAFGFLSTKHVGSQTELELPALESEVLTTEHQGSPYEMLVYHKIDLFLEEEMAAHSSILAWRIPWTE